jgi:dolichyl-phosphate beta-glucosyltransferase
VIGLSIIIPMYNEQDRIEPTVRDAVATLERWDRAKSGKAKRENEGAGAGAEGPWMLRERLGGGGEAPTAPTAEVLLVNDGSKDNTQAVAERLLRQLLANAGPALAGRVLRHEVNRGKGAAVRTGLAAASGAWALLMDADNATRLDQLGRFERAWAAGARREPDQQPVAMFAASRNTPDADIEAKWTRKFSGNIFKGALWALGLRLAKDTQCGFKLYRRDLAQYLAAHAKEDGFAFDIEHFLLCRHGGWDFREVGVHWEHKAGGKINVIADGLKMVARAKVIRDRIRRNPPPPPAAPAPHPSSGASAAPVVVEVKPAAREVVDK